MLGLIRKELLLVAVLCSGCAGLYATPKDPPVQPVPIPDRSTIAIAQFRGRGAADMELRVREAIDRRAMFMLVDSRRAHRLADEVQSRRSRGEEIDRTYRVETVVYGRVTENDVVESETFRGLRRMTAVVEVHFEIVDLRTGEVRGVRRIRRTRAQRWSIGDAGTLAEGNRLSRSRRREVSDALILDARQAAARDFARALTRGNSGGRSSRR